MDDNQTKTKTLAFAIKMAVIELRRFLGRDAAQPCVAEIRSAIHQALIGPMSEAELNTWERSVFALSVVDERQGRPGSVREMPASVSLPEPVAVYPTKEDKSKPAKRSTSKVSARAPVKRSAAKARTRAPAKKTPRRRRGG